MKKLCLLLALLFCFPLLPSCGAREHTRSFVSMGTTVTVTLYTQESAEAEAAFRACRSILTELEALWTIRDESSEIAQWNASPEGGRLDPRTLTLLETALSVAKATDGAFDPTVAPLSRLWENCGEENRLPLEEERAECLSHVGYGTLTLTDTALWKSDPLTEMDTGGIGKGAAMTALIAFLESTPITGGLVSFGSNVAVFGKKPNQKPFTVALRDPKNANGTVGKLTLAAGQVLSVSGEYERFVTIDGTRYHHILDPKTGDPAQTGLASVAVIAEDGALADALSTALFVMGKEASQAFYQTTEYRFEAVFIDSDGRVTLTDGLSDTWIGE